jgi:hypothetical protein
MASKTDDLACSRPKCLSKSEARTAILDFDSHQKEAALLEEHPSDDPNEVLLLFGAILNLRRLS